MFDTKFIVSLFINVLLTMIIIYIIKKVSNKYNIPFVKDVANEVY